MVVDFPHPDVPKLMKMIKLKKKKKPIIHTNESYFLTYSNKNKRANKRRIHTWFDNKFKIFENN